jgi:hypothetical protein
MTGFSEIHRTRNPGLYSANTTHALRMLTTLALSMHYASLYASVVAQRRPFQGTTIPIGDS